MLSIVTVSSVEHPALLSAKLYKPMTNSLMYFDGCTAFLWRKFDPEGLTQAKRLEEELGVKRSQSQ